MLNRSLHAKHRISTCRYAVMPWLEKLSRGTFWLLLTFNHNNTYPAYIQPVARTNIDNIRWATGCTHWTFIQTWRRWRANQNKKQVTGAQLENTWSEKYSYDAKFYPRLTKIYFDYLKSSPTVLMDKRPKSLFNIFQDNKTPCKQAPPHLSLKALFLEYLWRLPSSMMNLIFSKKEAVGAGGWRCSRMLMGLGTV